jgi:hypothetical protein
VVMLRWQAQRSRLNRPKIDPAKVARTGCRLVLARRCCTALHSTAHATWTMRWQYGPCRTTRTMDAGDGVVQATSGCVQQVV